jgi:hypothetical protein
MGVTTYNTTDLVNLVKMIGHVPVSNSTFTTPTLLTLADLELRTSIAKQLKESNEGYFQTYVEYAHNDTGKYPIPADAIASAPYSIQIRNGQAVWPVSRQEVSEMTTTEYPSVGNWACYIQANTVHVLPVQFSGLIRITYERRPSSLVAVTSCANISAINGQVVTVSSIPSGWVNGYAVDLQKSQPHFDLAGSATITNISSIDITLDGDLSELSVGDYICLSGQSCIPQIPVEFHPLLAQRVVCKIYELQGYFDKLKAAQAKLEEMEAALTALITPRVQSAPKVINPSWGGRKPGNSWNRFNPPASGGA